MARKRKSNNPTGRPSAGLTEVAKQIHAPAPLWAAVIVAALAEDVSVAEWVRRAMRLRLGWREVLSEPGATPSKR